MIHLELDGDPTPWSASRISKWGSFDPRAKTKKFIRWQIKSLYREKPLSGYYVIRLVFQFTPPISASKKEREAMLAGDIIPTSCDCTNLQKLYEDCLKKIVIEDDRKVAKIISEKLYGEQGKILITVYDLQEYRKKHETDH